jgi:hypothetical protein
MHKDEKAKKAIEGTEKPVKGKDGPTAGPHAKDHLTDHTKTPGAGSLPDEKEDSVNPGAG